MSDTVITAAVIGAVALHVAIGGLSLYPRRRTTPLLLTNIGFAATLIGIMAMAPATFRSPVDWQIMSGLGAEAIVIGLAVAGLRGYRGARGLSIAIFVLHLLLSAAAALFVVTFSIHRMF